MHTVLCVEARARLVALGIVDEIGLGRQLAAVAQVARDGHGHGTALLLALRLAKAVAHELAGRAVRRHGRREAPDVGFGLGDGAGAEKDDGGERLHFESERGGRAVEELGFREERERDPTVVQRMKVCEKRVCGDKLFAIVGHISTKHLTMTE